MDNFVRKGRIAKSKEEGVMESILIDDPVLGVYKIRIDEYSYNIVEKGNFSKEVPISYHTSLGSALNKISKLLLNKKKKIYTVLEYLKEYEKINQQIINAIPKNL